MTRENKDQLDIINSIKAEGGYAKKWASPYFNVGVQDIIASLPGIGLFLIEIKTLEGKISPKQQYEAEKFKNAGGLVLLIVVERRNNILIYPKAYQCFWESKRKKYSGIASAIRQIKQYESRL